MKEKLQYRKLVPSDPDIPMLLEVHGLPKISRYIKIDRRNYFHYVTHTDNVEYFKVIFENTLVAAVHIEKQENVLFLSILTLPDFQKRGFATQVLTDIQAKQLVTGFSEVVAFIDKENTPSIQLFEKAGFLPTSEEDGLLQYHYSV